MAQKFLSDIHPTAGLKDSSGDLGSDGQVLSSTGSNTNWVNPTVGATVIYKDAFTATNNQTAFTLANTVDSEDKTQVYIDGAYQSKGGYSVSGTTLTFDTGLVTSSAVEVITFSTATANNAASAVKIDTFTGDGSDLTFVLDEAVVDEKVTQVYINGVYQNKSTYSIAADLVTLTFGSGNAPPNSTAIEVISFKTITSTDGTLTATTFLGDLNGTINTATTATTQSAGNNTTKIATTAFVTTASNAKVADAINNGTTGIAPSQNAVFDALALKSNIAGPTFTGTPAAPTASAGTNTTQLATTAFVTTGIANIVDSSPGALNTLNELAAALGDDANFSTTITNSIALKAPLASPTFSGTVGMNVAPASTRTLLVKGQGTSSSTAPFQVNDGNNADILVIKDDKTATFSGDVKVNEVNPLFFADSTSTNKASGLITSESGTNKWAVGTNFGSSDNSFNIYNYAAASRYLTISSGGNATFTPSGGSVVLGSNGFITSTQALNAATAGGRFIGSSNRGVLGDIRIEQTAINADGGYMRFMTSPNGSTSPTEKMRITSAGDVGIGVASVPQQLTIGGRAAAQMTLLSSTTSGDSEIYFGDSGSSYRGAITYHHNGDYMRFHTNGSEKIRILANGKVGVGTTPGHGHFEISTASAIAYTPTAFINHANLRLVTGGTAATNVTTGISLAVSGGSEAYIGAVQNASGYADMVFQSYGGSYSEKMRITSGGIIKVNNATSTSQFNILSSLANSILELKSTSTNPFGIYIKYTQTMSADSNFFFRGDGSTGTRIIIQSNGDLENTHNSYGAISDIKLKENIIDATPKLNDLLKVKIRNYNLIKNDKKQIGVIAQELEEIFPAMVSESPDIEDREITDEEGNKTTEKVDLGTTTKSVKYSIFTPMLIKAIQEQQTIIQDLKSRIETLEG